MVRVRSAALSAVLVAAIGCGGEGARSQQIPGLATAGTPAGVAGERAVQATAGSPNAGGANAGAMPASGNGGTGGIGAGGAPSLSGGGTLGTAPPPGGSSSGGAVGGSAQGGGAQGGTAGAPVADPPGTAVLKSDAFMVMPGAEVIKCQNFDDPLGGDKVIGRFVSDMTRGSHHLNLFNLTEGTSRTIEDCPSSDFHALAYGAPYPHLDTTFPEGMAAKLHGAKGFRMQLHYLNTTTDPIQAGATVKMYPVADTSKITKWVASMFLERLGFSVPPGQGQDVTTTCSVPASYGQIGLVWAASHMHRHGTHFVASTSTGTKLLDDSTWDEPMPRTFDPPVLLSPGDSVTWTCTYDNDTGSLLTYGDSASKNEMCIFGARYYSTDPNDVQIECHSLLPNGGVATLQPN